VTAQERAGLVGHGAEDRVRSGAARDERRDPPQRRLFLGETAQVGLGLAARGDVAGDAVHDAVLDDRHRRPLERSRGAVLAVELLLCAAPARGAQSECAGQRRQSEAGRQHEPGQGRGGGQARRLTLAERAGAEEPRNDECEDERHGCDVSARHNLVPPVAPRTILLRSGRWGKPSLHRSGGRVDGGRRPAGFRAGSPAGASAQWRPS